MSIRYGPEGSAAGRTLRSLRSRGGRAEQQGQGVGPADGVVVGYRLGDGAVDVRERQGGPTGTAGLSAARTVEELRAEDRSHRVLSVEQAVEMVRAGTSLALHPLVGGLPPEIGWRYLRTVADKVLPALP